EAFFQIVQHQKVISGAVHFPEFHGVTPFRAIVSLYYNNILKHGKQENVLKTMQILLSSLEVALDLRHKSRYDESSRRREDRHGKKNRPKHPGPHHLGGMEAFLRSRI
ncbi:MAG: hypothetical protein IJF36_00035, partial [Oscillibacter sp.]|nr:hypothetical protein [Oscillibacter sp.]